MSLRKRANAFFESLEDRLESGQSDLDSMVGAVRDFRETFVDEEEFDRGAGDDRQVLHVRAHDLLQCDVQQICDVRRITGLPAAGDPFVILQVTTTVGEIHIFSPPDNIDWKALLGGRVVVSGDKKQCITKEDWERIAAPN